MEVAKVYPTDKGNGEEVWIFCPGCNTHHSFKTKNPLGHPVWSWNGSLQKPTFSPSMLVTYNNEGKTCHSFVIDGNIQFLGDCYHDLAGKTVPLPDIDLST